MQNNVLICFNLTSIFFQPGTNTIAVMSGSECYDSLKTCFKDCWDEINEIIHEGEVEINLGYSIPVEVFLGGDYKVKYFIILN